MEEKGYNIYRHPQNYVKYYILFNLFITDAPEDHRTSIIVERWLGILINGSGIKILFDDEYYAYKAYVEDKFMDI